MELPEVRFEGDVILRLGDALRAGDRSRRFCPVSLAEPLPPALSLALLDPSPFAAGRALSASSALADDLSFIDAWSLTEVFAAADAVSFAVVSVLATLALWASSVLAVDGAGRLEPETLAAEGDVFLDVVVVLGTEGDLGV